MSLASRWPLAPAGARPITVQSKPGSRVVLRLISPYGSEKSFRASWDIPFEVLHVERRWCGVPVRCSMAPCSSWFQKPIWTRQAGARAHRPTEVIIGEPLHVKRMLCSRLVDGAVRQPAPDLFRPKMSQMGPKTQRSRCRRLAHGPIDQRK